MIVVRLLCPEGLLWYPIPSLLREQEDLCLLAETNASSWFQNAMQDSLDMLTVDWHSLSEAINEVNPQSPVNSHSRLIPWYPPELWIMKQDLRKLE